MVAAMCINSILIVEDDDMIRKALVTKFTQEGLTVFSAENGKQGIEVALKQKPDMLLVDILMPVMDGITMLETLRREQPWGKSVPVVILSNLEPDDPKIHNLAQLNPLAHLVKADWPVENIMTIINRCSDEMQGK